MKDPEKIYKRILFQSTKELEFNGSLGKNATKNGQKCPQIWDKWQKKNVYKSIISVIVFC